MTGGSRARGPGPGRKGAGGEPARRKRSGAAAPPPEVLEDAVRAACRASRKLSPRRRRGAALLTRGGAVIQAPEIEDIGGAGVGVCAERLVLYQALMQGRRGFRALLVRAGDGASDGGAPCGACLQVLLEFAPDLRVYWGTARRPRGGVPARLLLPGAFGPGHLREKGGSRGQSRTREAGGHRT